MRELMDDKIFLNMEEGRLLYSRLTNNGTTPISVEQVEALSKKEQDLILLYWLYGNIEFEEDIIATESWISIMDGLKWR